MADATDNFNRGSLGSNWTTKIGNAVVIVGSTAITGTASNNCAVMWNADAFANDQYSQIVVAVDNEGGGPAVRMQAGSDDWYEWYTEASTTCTMYEVTAGSFAALGSNYSNNTGLTDVIKLDITGSTLTPSLNGSTQATRSDASLTSGSPGIHIFSNLCQFDDWLGGPIAAGGTTLDATTPGSYAVTGSVVTDKFTLTAGQAGA